MKPVVNSMNCVREYDARANCHAGTMYFNKKMLCNCLIHIHDILGWLQPQNRCHINSNTRSFTDDVI